VPSGARDEAVQQEGGRQALRLLQGYLWHPRELELDFADYLPRQLDGDIHLLWDALPQAPFAFFDDGTLSATQLVYQFTVMTYAEDDDDPGGLLPWLAETLQQKLEATPAGVGWQLFDDLRPLLR
jgi:hypothetical protein